MAKAVALVASALCLFALAGFAHAAPPKKDENVKFTIEGKVYCDPCRVQFVTKLSKFLEGADVVLLCKNEETGNVTYTAQGKSGKDGTYTVQAEGDHGDEICEMKVSTSPAPDCGEAMDETAPVTLTDNGMSTDVRYANYIGFMKNEADPECPKVLEELGIYSDDADDEANADANPDANPEANPEEQPAN